MALHSWPVTVPRAPPHSRNSPPDLQHREPGHSTARIARNNPHRISSTTHHRSNNTPTSAQNINSRAAHDRARCNSIHHKRRSPAISRSHRIAHRHYTTHKLVSLHPRRTCSRSPLQHLLAPENSPPPRPTRTDIRRHRIHHSALTNHEAAASLSTFAETGHATAVADDSAGSNIHGTRQRRGATRPPHSPHRACRLRHGQPIRRAHIARDTRRAQTHNPNRRHTQREHARTPQRRQFGRLIQQRNMARATFTALRRTPEARHQRRKLHRRLHRHAATRCHVTIAPRPRMATMDDGAS